MAIKYKKIIINHWHWLLLTILAVAFFFGASSYNYLTQQPDFIKWSSPDEAANYNFTKLYAQTGQLSFFEKYNLASLDVIIPRSYRSDLGWIKPVSFLGLILIYGKIAAVFGYRVIPYLTPAVAALGIIFYYLLVGRIFGKRNALFSALLLAFFPPYVYYSARSMFHNVLFLVLLIISLYYSVLSVKNNGRGWFGLLSAALSGSFLGLAVITRASELIWLAPLWLIIWIFNIKKFGFYKLIIFLAFALFSLLPALFWNKILYQSFWQGGYNEANRSVMNIASAGSSLLTAAAIKSNLALIKNSIFYFGFQPAKSLSMLYYYFARMFYWLFWPAAAGMLMFALKIKKWRRRHYAYLTAYASAALILLFYYGSWDFHDNPDPASQTIGNSYTRYWLPLYLGALPLASMFFSRLSNLSGKKFLASGARALIIMIIFIISLKFVLSGSAEGLAVTARKQAETRQEFNRVMELTEPRAVIITRYHDKLLFPERKVIVGLFDDDNMVEQYANLAKYLPVYYYNFTFPERDINYLNNSKLPSFGLQIEPVARVTDAFSLYKLYENRH